MRCERPRSDELRERLEPESYLRSGERGCVHSIADDDERRRQTAQERTELAEAAVECRPQREMRWEIEHDEVERSGQHEKTSEFEGLGDGLWERDEEIEDSNTPVVQAVEVDAVCRIEVGDPATSTLDGPNEPARERPLAGVGWASQLDQPAARKPTAECEIETEEIGREEPRARGRAGRHRRSNRSSAERQACRIEQHVRAEALGDELAKPGDPLAPGIVRAARVRNLRNGACLASAGAHSLASASRYRHVSPFPCRKSHMRS